jgi:hypothetical protein
MELEQASFGCLKRNLYQDEHEMKIKGSIIDIFGLIL